MSNSASEWVFDLVLPGSFLVNGESLGQSPVSLPAGLEGCHNSSPSGVTAVFTKAVVEDAVGCMTESALCWS